MKNHSHRHRWLIHFPSWVRRFPGVSLPYLHIYLSLSLTHTVSHTKEDIGRWRCCETNARFPCLGSDTSKAERRAVKGPRGVRPSDRTANWYVRLRSPVLCPPPWCTLVLRLGMIGCRTRDRPTNRPTDPTVRSLNSLTLVSEVSWFLGNTNFFK